jgi:hypothetical protein
VCVGKYCVCVCVCVYVCVCRHIGKCATLLGVRHRRLGMYVCIYVLRPN